MNSLMIVVTAVSGISLCGVPKLVNYTGQWTGHDSEVYTGALSRCKVHFGEDAPCLKKFIKKDERLYYAICGKEPSKLRHSSSSHIYWFTISAPEGKVASDFISGGSTNEGQGCHGSCPLRPKTGAGGK